MKFTFRFLVSLLLPLAIFLFQLAAANGEEKQARAASGPSSITKSLGQKAGVAVAPTYSRKIPDQNSYLRLPCLEALESLGLKQGSSVTGPYLLHRSREGQTMSFIGRLGSIDLEVAQNHIKRIQLERELTGQSPVTLFLGEVAYSKDHIERTGETGRIHIGSSLAAAEFFSPVTEGKVFGAKSKEDLVADINKYLTGLYSQKYLPGAILVNGQPFNGIPVKSAFGYYQGVFGTLPGSILIRTGSEGELTDRASILAALDALEEIMRSAGATDFGRAYPRIRKIVLEQGDHGGGYTIQRP